MCIQSYKRVTGAGACRSKAQDVVDDEMPEAFVSKGKKASKGAAAKSGAKGFGGR